MAKACREYADARVKNQQQLDTALFNAAGRGDHKAVSLLLAHGANRNMRAPLAGYTPLMWAAYSEDLNVETVKLLLEKGADTKAQGANGETPLSLAKKRSGSRSCREHCRRVPGDRPGGHPGGRRKEPVAAPVVRADVLRPLGMRGLPSAIGDVAGRGPSPPERTSRR